MRLSLQQRLLRSMMTWLLIEPVWNWNLTQLLTPYDNEQVPFNRTSMELKLDFHTILCRLGYQLLIEPVWNWNFTLSERPLPGALVDLLIEPVWNWNCSTDRSIRKPIFLFTFNRTSMESKPATLHYVSTIGVITRLLIEPVWNRNGLLIGNWFRNTLLLIEPVWNWNEYVRFLMSSSRAYF